jgi:hypothetical protein
VTAWAEKKRKSVPSLISLGRGLVTTLLFFYGALPMAEIDTSSAKEVRQRTREVRNAEEQFAKDLDVVLSSTEGRRVLWYLAQGDALEGSGALNEAFVAGMNDVTAYRLGRQSFSRMILGELLKPARLHFYQQIVEENATLALIREGRNG